MNVLKPSLYQLVIHWALVLAKETHNPTELDLRNKNNTHIGNTVQFPKTYASSKVSQLLSQGHKR